MSIILLIPVIIIVYYVFRYFCELIPQPGDKSFRAVFISGCDTGFGRLLALKCAKNGIPVYAGCLTKKGEENLINDSKNLDGKLLTVLLDVTKDESVASAKDFVINDLDKHPKKVLWAIVNNAGIFSVYGPDEWCTIEDYNRSIEVNLYGVIRCTKAFLPLLKKSKGRIISVSSVSGRISTPFSAPYCVAKYGVEAYMDAIRIELAVFGIKCSILEPGMFKTALLSSDQMIKRADMVWNRLSPKIQNEYGLTFKERFVELWNNFMYKNASNCLNFVVDNYYHAITARFPRCRYRCGYDSLFFFIPLTYLPTEIIDFVLSHTVKDPPIPDSVIREAAKKNK